MDIAGFKAKASACVELARPFNALAALVSFAVGYAFYAPAEWSDFWLGLLVLLLLHSVATVQNDIYDLEIDKTNDKQRALVRGALSIQDAKYFIILLTAGSLFLASLSGQKFIYLLFIGLFLLIGWVYNCPPFFLSRRPVLSITMLAVYYTSLPLAFGLALAGRPLTTMILLYISVSTAQRFSISLLKDFKDVLGDKKHHKHTFLLRFGYKPTVRISILLCAISYIATVMLLGLRAPTMGLVPGLVCIAAIAAYNSLFRLQLLKTTDYKKLNLVFRKSFGYENIFGLVVLGCLILS